LPTPAATAGCGDQHQGSGEKRYPAKYGHSSFCVHRRLACDRANYFAASFMMIELVVSQRRCTADQRAARRTGPAQCGIVGCIGRALIVVQPGEAARIGPSKVRVTVDAAIERFEVWT
jgi:hypothetical protein